MSAPVSVHDCRLVPLPRRAGDAGCLTVFEPGDAVPFEVRRTFTIADVPAGARRGGHANARTRELIVCLRGAVTVRARDGRAETSHRLDSADVGFYLPAMMWVDLEDFAPDTILLVLADTSWEEARDAYHRDYSRWLRRVLGSGAYAA